MNVMAWRKNGIWSLLWSLVLGLSSDALGAAPVWPALSLPDQISIFPIAEQFTAEGMPMHLQGFVSALTPARLAPALRHTLGQPLVEQNSASALVLGRARGDFYLTVKLESSGTGSRGWIAMAQVNHPEQHQQDAHASRAELLARLPDGSRIVSDLSSNDDGKLARHILVSNHASAASNVETVKSMLQADGLQLEYDTQNAAPHAQGRILFFKSKDKEAMASVRQDQAGNSLLIVNIVQAAP